MTENNRMKEMPVNRLMMRMGLPMILSMALQAVYNIVDSAFVGNMREGGEAALNAMTLAFPVQMLMVALAIGTGVGVNALLARTLGQGNREKAAKVAGNGLFLGAVIYLICLLFGLAGAGAYIASQTADAQVIGMTHDYLFICCTFSFGVVFFSLFEKLLQATGRSLYSTIGQITGAVINIVLDPVMIYGLGPVPELGVAGAAYATVCGQVAAAVITSFGGVGRLPERTKMPLYIKQIYWFGYASIIMQALFTVYIVILNAILAGFSDSAVTVLGLYYKMQTFFFIPLMGLQTCIVPVLSFNYATKSYARCREIMRDSYGFSCVFMLVGVICFVFFPVQLLQVFSKSSEVIAIGKNAFPIIGASFIPAVFSLMTPVFFQAIGNGKISLFLSVMRQICCLIPIFWLLSLIDLRFTWFAFPISEVLVGVTGIVLYYKEIKRDFDKGVA